MGLFNRVKMLPRKLPDYFESNIQEVVYDEGNRLSVYHRGYNGCYLDRGEKFLAYVKYGDYNFVALVCKYQLLADLRTRLGPYDEQNLYYVKLDNTTTKQEDDVIFFGTYAETVELMKREAPEAVFSEVYDGDRVDFNGDRYCGTIVQLKSNAYIFNAFKQNCLNIPIVDEGHRYELDTGMMYLNDN